MVRARVACLGLLALLGAARTATLRVAFLKTLSDPQFLSDARRAKLDIDPVSGEEVERLVGELFRMPQPVLAKLKELLR